VIFYADKITDSMRRTMEETDRRRVKQMAYNDRARHHAHADQARSRFGDAADRRDGRGRRQRTQSLCGTRSPQTWPPTL
jgi:excinuclease UvrABC helicase subunit UvrB